MSELATYWTNTANDPRFNTLGAPNILPAQGVLNDYRAVNWDRLLGDQAPKLSIYNSETRFYDQYCKRFFPSGDGQSPTGFTNFEIRRRFDIDSCFIHAESLAFFRGGFKLSYTPSFHSSITQDPHIRFANVQIHQKKQIRLGYGLRSHGIGFACHVVFPQTDVNTNQTSHFSEEELQDWTDTVIIPSLRAVYRTDTIQHHPRSYREVQTKSKVSKEDRFGGIQASMDLRYIVSDLDHGDYYTLWAHVKDAANAHPRPSFHQPMLIVSAHDFKAQFKRDSLASTLMAFNEETEVLFRKEHLVQTEPGETSMWVDIGIEDCPSGGIEPTTLLWKSACNKA